MNIQTSDDVSPLSIDIIQSVAEVADEDPVVLPPLYNYIDPDALDSLFNDHQTGQIEFRYAGYCVTVSFGDTESISVTEQR